MTKIIIEVSARHCHLSRAHLDKLFGVGHELKPIKELSQAGQFAAEETVTLKTKNGQIDNLRILGPVRSRSQVELSMTDARKVKIEPPLRLSGDVKDSAGGTLIGPKGVVLLSEGIIVAKRHIHCDPVTAKKLKLKNGQIVSVKTPGDRSVVFNDIEVRIDKKFVWRLHIDTDEGNASMPDGVCSEGELII